MALAKAEKELEVVDDTQSEEMAQFQEKLKREQAEFHANLKEQRKNFAEDVEEKLKVVEQSSQTVVTSSEAKYITTADMDQADMHASR